MMMSQDAKARSQKARKTPRSYLHLSTPRVTYSATGFSSLNTRGCVSVSNHSLTLPVKVLGGLGDLHNRPEQGGQQQHGLSQISYTLLTQVWCDCVPRLLVKITVSENYRAVR